MNRLALLAFAAAAASAPLAVHACPIPYTVGYTSGTIVAPTSVVHAAGGDIQAQFVGFIGKPAPGLTDTVGIFDETTGKSSQLAFTNHTTAIGSTLDFGTFAKGDLLDFEVASAPRYNYMGIYQPATLFGSDPALNSDGVNHAYLTGFAGGTIANVVGDSATNPFQFMQGTFVGMEDLAINPNSNPNGLTDYNDDSYIFTNVNVTQTPEPSSLLLMGTGALAFAGALRRRIFN